MNNDYPSSVLEVMDPPLRFRKETFEAVRRFAQSKPWRGDMEERKAKIAAVHADLCRVYGRQTRLNFGVLDGSDSGASYYSPMEDAITLCGRLSVITYLHEFAHALGRDERGACRWSIHLFRRSFPKSWSRLVFQGHMVRQPSRMVPRPCQRKNPE